MHKQGRKYLGDMWNYADQSIFILFVGYFISRMTSHDSILPNSNTDTDQDMAFWVSVHSLMLVFSVIKVLGYLKLDDRFGLMVDLIVQVIKDVYNFCIFLVCWLVLCVLLYKVSGFSMGNDDDYPLVNSNLVLFLNMFRNSIGDVQTPKYDWWTTTQEGSTITGIMIGYAWILFITHQFLLLIILVNFLIAMVSQSYDSVVSEKQIRIYQSKCYFNSHGSLLRDAYLKLIGGNNTHHDVYVLTCNNDDSMEDSSQFAGFVKSIKEHTHQEMHVMKATFSTMLKTQMQQMQT